MGQGDVSVSVSGARRRRPQSWTLAVGLLLLVTLPFWGLPAAVALNVAVGEVAARWPPGREDRVAALAEAEFPPAPGLVFTGVHLAPGEMGVGPWCVAYTARQDPAMVLAHYRRQMADHGWAIALDQANTMGAFSHYLIAATPGAATIMLGRPDAGGSYAVEVCSRDW